MLLAIALINSNGTKLLRIVDTSTATVSDIDINDVQSLNNIRNIRVNKTVVECTEGNISNYPTLTNGQVQNNIPVYIATNGDKADIVNYAGKIITVDLNQLRAQIKQFANGKWNSSGRIEIVKSTSTISTAQSNTLSPLESLMRLEGKPVDVHNFNARDYYINLGVTPDVYKDPYSIFVLNRPQAGVKIESDRSAYKFEIVKVGNRIELRKYEGAEYTGEVIVPPEVTHICEGVFSSTKFKKLVMSDNVVYLGDRAFAHSAVEEVVLSSKVTAIPFACFAFSAISNINLENIASIDNEAFKNSNIQEVKVKAPLIQVGYSAFEDCKNLELFEHAGTIKKIRHDAFKNCILLTYFDFSSVLTLEQYAFYNTGITEAKLNGEINYLQSGTITGKIEQIELLEGFTKIAAGAVSNIDNKPIVWTMPRSAQNLEKNVFTSQDTVMCYRGTVSATQALLDDAQIIYLDSLDNKSIPSVIKKANMINASVEDILRDTLIRIIDKGDFEADYDISNLNLVSQDIPDSILSLVGLNFRYGSYATQEDIDNEKIKFKAILHHLSKVGQLDITPFSSVALDLKSTFRVVNKNKKSTQVLYDDGVSSVHRIRYADNKFTSVDSEFIVAKTKDTLRYICIDNRYTDLMCENPEIHDLTKLLNILRPGDTIGLNCVISGVKYPEISSKTDKKIQVTNNGVKRQKNLIMNIYQALRYSSITLKLDANTIILILPGNRKIIKCASLGRSVWQNEKEETYKSLQCTIVSIEDIDESTIFDYESTYKASNYGPLFKRLRQVYSGDKQSYIEAYSHIYKAQQSMYKVVGNYAYRNNMTKIEELDTEFMRKLFNTSLFEERQSNWLEGSIGKTVVPDVEFEFRLSDGARLRQYRTVKKTALRNKLMSGGDRKLYIFELIDIFGMRNGVYVSLYDIRTLTDMCLGINDILSKQDRDILDSDDGRIFVNQDKFDVVGFNNVIEIAPLCRENKLRTQAAEAGFIFAVYKPNGLYYIGLKVKYGKTFRFIPVMQIGELEVALGFIEESNKLGTGSEAMKYLSLGASEILFTEYASKLGKVYYRQSNQVEYLGLLKAREMCIAGISDISQYNKIGIPEILKRCLGYSENIDELYKKEVRGAVTNETPTKTKDKSDLDTELTLDLSGLDESDLDAIRVANNINIDDPYFDFSDDELIDL